MSLWASSKLAFRRVGVMFRDHELRLQELEKRTVSLYPVTKFSNVDNGATFPNQEVYRPDGTLALRMVFAPAPLTAIVPAGIHSTNFNNTVSTITITIYGLNGTTVVHSYVLKMDSDTGDTTNTRGLINGSSIQ